MTGSYRIQEHHLWRSVPSLQRRRELHARSMWDRIPGALGFRIQAYVVRCEAVPTAARFSATLSREYEGPLAGALWRTWFSNVQGR